ncbi:MAG: hypothetical protein E4H22_05235, partial [Solirubrobacterales bacterium]
MGQRSGRVPRVSEPLIGAPADINLRPLAAGDEGELLRIHRTAEVSRWWDAPDPEFPWDERESTRLVVEVD